MIYEIKREACRKPGHKHKLYYYVYIDGVWQEKPSGTGWTKVIEWCKADAFDKGLTKDEVRFNIEHVRPLRNKQHERHFADGSISFELQSSRGQSVSVGAELAAGVNPQLDDA